MFIGNQFIILRIQRNFQLSGKQFTFDRLLLIEADSHLSGSNNLHAGNDININIGEISFPLFVDFRHSLPRFA